MALLIDIRQPEWMTDTALRQLLAPMLPNVPIYCGIEAARDDVRMAAVVKLYPGVAQRLPSLALVQKLGAGVEEILDDPDLAENTRITRLVSQVAADEIAEYCLSYVLQFQRNIPEHSKNSAAQCWRPIAPRLARDTIIGVMGLGQIGGRTARCFVQAGFCVLGWSRSQKTLIGIECHAGISALPEMLRRCDYIICVLPSTDATRNLFDADLLAVVKPGAILINVGRGDLLVDQALLQQLDEGPLGGSVLDVFREEPLPANHNFWRHPKIIVTPHVSGWHLDDAFADVAENYRRLEAGSPLLHEVDRGAGY